MYNLLLGLLAPSAPPRTEVIEEELNRSSNVQSNELLPSSGLLEAGTPPPSYAEALASISDNSNEHDGNTENQGQGERT